MKRHLTFIVLILIAILNHAQTAGYRRIRGLVYYSDRQIETADFITCKILIHGYAKDKDKVYYKGDVLSYVDPKTFRLKGMDENNGGTMPDSEYFKIDHYVFYNGEKVKGVHSIRDFRDLGNGYAIDAFNAYYEGVRVDDASVHSFKNLGDGYAKDTFNAYYKGLKIVGASAHSFKNLEKGCANDSFHTYFKGQRTEK